MIHLILDCKVWIKIKKEITLEFYEGDIFCSL